MTKIGEEWPSLPQIVLADPADVTEPYVEQIPEGANSAHLQNAKPEHASEDDSDSNVLFDRLPPQDPAAVKGGEHAGRQLPKRRAPVAQERDH